MRYRADKVPGSLGKTLPLGYCLLMSWPGVQVLGPPLVYLWKTQGRGGGCIPGRQGKEHRAPGLGPGGPWWSCT